MGADLVLDHAGDVAAQLASANIPHVDMVLSTAKTADNVGWIAKVLRPFGHLSIVDFPSSLDLGSIGMKSISLHTEMVFTRILHGSSPHLQGAILGSVANFVSEGKIRPIATTRLDGLTTATMKRAHELVETTRAVGKIVLTFD